MANNYSSYCAWRWVIKHAFNLLTLNDVGGTPRPRIPRYHLPLLIWAVFFSVFSTMPCPFPPTTPYLNSPMPCSAPYLVGQMMLVPFCILQAEPPIITYNRVEWGDYPDSFNRTHLAHSSCVKSFRFEWQSKALVPIYSLRFCLRNLTSK